MTKPAPLLPDLPAPLDQLDQIVLGLDSDYRVVQANPRARLALNLSGRKATGQTIDEIFPGFPIKGLLEVQETNSGISMCFSGGGVEGFLPPFFEADIIPVQNNEAGSYLVLRDISGLAAHFREYLGQREMVRSFFEIDELGMAVVDADDVFKAVSGSFAAILGYDPEELIGAHIKKIFYSPENYKERRLHQEWQELRLRHRTGRSIWVNLGTKSVYDSLKRPLYTMHFLQDVGPRKRVEKELIESRQLFQNAFSDAAFGMIIFSGQGTIVRINNFLCELLGYEEEELIGKHFVDITHQDDIELSLESDRRILDREIKCAFYEKRYLHRDGTPIWVFVSNSLMYDEKGRPYYFVAHAQDIRKRKIAEQALIDSEYRFQLFMDNFPGKAFIKDDLGRYQFGNRFFWRSLGERNTQDMTGVRDEDIYPDSCAAQMEQNDQIVRETGQAHESIETIENGTEESFWLTSRFPIEQGRDNVLLGGIALDVTTHVKTQQELEQRDFELKEQGQNLERVNTALKVMIEHREKEMKKKEIDMLSHLEKLVAPYLGLMRNSGLNSEQASYLDIALNNLKNITDDFASRLSSPEILLSPTELQVADLLRHGKTSYEIADALNISPHTVSRHRAGIRKKLKLTNKKINLSLYLASLASTPHKP